MPMTPAGLEQERLFWDTRKEAILCDRALRDAWLRSQANLIEAMVIRAGGALDRVLQIGAGPHDVVDVGQWNERCAIDPLADYYKENFAELQDPKVDYRQGVGESLPWEDKTFDLVIIRNVIDHVSNPGLVLRESQRVLKLGGHLYIWVHVVSRRFVLLRGMVDIPTHKFRNSAEPFGFSCSRIRRIVAKSGFEILLEARENEKPRPLTPKNVLRRILGAKLDDYHLLACTARTCTHFT